MNSRIPEIDILRGFCVYIMIFYHFLYDLALLGMISELPECFRYVAIADGTAFILISGYCSTLSMSLRKRGILLLLAGSAIAWISCAAGNLMQIAEIEIRFGVLQLLGVSMLLIPLFTGIPETAKPAVIGFLILGGAFFSAVRTEVPYLFWIGLRSTEFHSSDYWPLFPYLGIFFAGSLYGSYVLSRLRKSFPSPHCSFPLLQQSGRHSLAVYLIHQPVILGFLLIIKSLNML